jgi:hypothetical protein
MKRRNSIALMFAGAMLVNTGCHGEKPMIDLLEMRKKDFKKEIGFDESIKKEVANEKVFFDWQKLTLPTELQDWKVSNFHVEAGDWGTKYTWGYVFQQFNISIEISSYTKATGLELANDLMFMANNTTMMNIPYKKSSIPLGTVAIEPKYKSPHGVSYYWIYRNISFKVQGDDEQVVIKVAQTLQSTAESNTKPQ